MVQIIRRPAFARRLSGLVRDTRGVSVVEFGLFFPILALLVLGTIDIGKGLAVQFGLEQATQRTVELASGAGPRTDYNFLIAEAAAAAAVPTASVTLDQWLECRAATGAITRTVITGSCPATSEPAKYVTITIAKTYTPWFGSIPFLGALGTGPGGAMVLTADSGVRVG